MPSRALGYARVSSQEQALGSSLQDQQNALGAYAKARGLKRVARFFVEAESAIYEKQERREQLRLLMADLRPGDLVLCDKLDRWSRDPEFTYRTMREIREAGAKVYFVGESLDPTTPEGDSMLGLRVVFAREEHKRIRLRMVGTRKLLRDRGYYVEGLPPLGYRRSGPKGQRGPQKNVLAIDDRDAALVRTFFRKCIAGQSLTDILAHVQEHRKDRAWAKSDICNALRNRTYLGEVENSQGVWIKGLHKAIVDEATFSRAQTALDSRRLGGAKPKGDSRTKSWLLRQIGRCGRCGSKMSAAYGGGWGREPKKYVDYYTCGKKCGARGVRVDSADPAMAGIVLARLVELRALLAKPPAKETAPVKKPPPGGLTERKAKLQRKRDRFVELYADGTIAGPAFRAALAKVDAERMRLEDQERALAKPSPLRDPPTREKILGHVRKLATAWRRTNPEQKRQIITLLAVGVKLERERAPKPVWRTPEELATDFPG